LILAIALLICNNSMTALIIGLKKAGKITLNNEDYGKVDDLAPLENKLKDVFAARKQFESELRKQTNNPLTKTYLQIPAEMTAFDENINKVSESLKRAGAEPILINIK
jgi:hypothetical protein